MPAKTMALLLAALTAGCAMGSLAPSAGDRSAEARAPRGMKVSVGPEEPLIELGDWGTRYIPDGHVTYLRLPDGSSHYWFAGGTVVGAGEALAMTATDGQHFEPRLLRDGNAVGSLLPNHPGSAAPDADYAGPGSVFRAKNGRDLLMIYHGENHSFGGVDNPPGNPFYATICLARSHDGGLHWTREGAIISGMQPKPVSDPPRQALGAGNPDAVIAGGYVYVFYVDWSYDLEPDQTHVARARLSGDAAPETWKKWYGGSFSTAGLGGKSTPVIDLPAPPAKTVYASDDSVSYNASLRRYVSVYLTAIGFELATSTDLVHWGAGRQIFAFGHSEDSMKTGETWYYYPSFLSPGQADDRHTTADGYLYYAKAKWGVTPHTMYRRSLHVTP